MKYEAFALIADSVNKSGVDFFHTLGIHFSQVIKLGTLFQTLKYRENFKEYDKKLSEFESVYFSLFK